MKKTDLVKNLGLKILGQMQHSPIPGRFGVAASAVPDRREQRKLDQAAGLVPFAVKLHHDLVKRLHDQVQQEGGSLNELTARLIEAGFAAGGAAAPVKAAPKPASKRSATDSAPQAQTSTAAKPASKKTAARPASQVPAKTAVKAAAKKAAKPAAKPRKD